MRCIAVDPLTSACRENEYDALYSLDRRDEAWQRYLAALDRGAITVLYPNFQTLARFEQKAAFLFASNQSRFLPRFHRHATLYEAHRDLDSDHAELVREAQELAKTERIETDNGYLVLQLPLGAYDPPPVMPLLWGVDNRRYRESPQFKRFIRKSGVLDYWRKTGFPAQCRPIAADDFRCD